MKSGVNSKRGAYAVEEAVIKLGFRPRVEERATSRGILYVVNVSAENGDGAADYYGASGYPEISPKLEALAKARGGFWEWVNPGEIALWD